MEKKLTKKENFEMIKAVPEVAANEDLVAFIDHEIELLDKKSANKKATKTQEQNVGIKAEILNTLSEVGVTVTELLAKSEVLGAYQNQKISALLKQLIDEGKVVKTYDKKKAYFALLPEVDVEVEVEEVAE